MDIPRIIDDITPEWLTAALHSGDKPQTARVESIHVEPIGQGMGFTGEVAHISVKYSTDLGSMSSSLIAKIATPDDGVREFATRLGLFEREIRIYVELGEEIGVRIPKLFYGDFDTNSGHFILLLEDLSHLRTGDETVSASISVEDAYLAVTNAALLHARWWDSDKLASCKWLDHVLDPIRVRSRQQIYQEAWIGVSGRLKADLPPEVYEIGDRLHQKFFGVWSDAAPTPLTLNHGDYRLANLFFDDDRVVTFDWQTAMYGPPAIDLADFLVWSLTVDQRRAHEDRLIDLYIESLIEQGVKNYSRDMVIRDCRLGMLRNLEIYVNSIQNLDMDTAPGRVWIDAVSPRMIALAEWDCGASIPG